MQKQSNTFYYALMVVLFCLHVVFPQCHSYRSGGIFKLKTLVLLIVLFCFNPKSYSQELVNPSFEGVTGVARIPTAWQPYGPSSSPDTQPSAWNVTTEASHGSSYISMVCRGFSITDSYLWESCTQALNNPLIVGESYHYSIDLAHSKTFLADTFLFDTPAQLRIWGMNNQQQKELLWESGVIANTEWKSFYFNLEPSIPTDFLILEAYYVALPKYNGNLLIDNMKYYPAQLIKRKENVPQLIVENKPDTIPTEIDGRPIDEATTFTFRGDKLTLTVWDNRTTDGDVISLFLNNKKILNEFTISKNRLEVEVAVEEGQEYYLTLFAHNLGNIPPNTVAMYISDGQRKKLITLTSDLNKCGAVKLKIEQPLANAKL